MENEAKVTAEIEAIKARQNEQDKRQEKIDTNIQRIWEKLDGYRDGQVEMRVTVENLGKSMFEMRHDIKTLVENSNKNEVANSKKWEGFWSKLAWTIVGVLGTIILFKLGLVPK